MAKAKGYDKEGVKPLSPSHLPPAERRIEFGTIPA